MSVLSFAERGPWGDAKWRGNCSGFVYQALFRSFALPSLLTPCVVLAPRLR